MKFLWPLIILLPTICFAESCPSGNAPACPSTGVRILDDTYPVQSFVISQQPSTNSDAGQALPRRTMLEVMRAYNFSPNTTPNIIYPARREDFDYLKPLLIQDLVRAGRSQPEATNLIDQKLRFVEAKPWTWQQDYFEATFDPATGNPRINYSQIYDKRDRSSTTALTRKSFASIAGANICGLQSGQELSSSVLRLRETGTVEKVARTMGTTPTIGGEFGGNMEGLPGGLCLVGDNMTDEFAMQVCGPRENMVKIEVNWLGIGHVDEIMKVIPDRRQIAGRPPECGFSIMSADTELGLNLLAAPGALNQSVLQLNLNSDASSSLPEGTSGSRAFQKTMMANPSTKLICRILNERNNGVNPGTSQPGSVIEACVEFLIPSARAQTPPSSEASRQADQQAFNCLNNHGEVKNREFVEKIRSNSGLLRYNTAIQDSLIRSRQKIYDSILGRLPQCRPFFRTVDEMFTKVPNFFGPTDPDEAGTHVRSGRIGFGASASSFFPNPTNGLMMNNSVIFPGPGPAAYKDYLNSSIRALGLTPAHVDTWDYAHSAQGNLHCASHSIPYCRPAGAR